MSVSSRQLVWVVLIAAGLAAAGCAKSSGGESADPSVALQSGWTNFRLSEFDLALRDFESALAGTEKGGETYLRALFGLANVWNLRRPGEDTERAKKLYRRILDEAPGHDLAAWCDLALVRLQHVVPVGETPDYDAVRAGYRRLIETYPGHLAAKESTIYLNATLIATLDEAKTREAVSNLNAFVATGTKEFLRSAYSLLAVSYKTLDMQEERLNAEILSFQNVEVDPANPFNEYAWDYWNIATIAEFEVGDFDLARQYYMRLIREYPADQRVFPSKEALARMDRVEAGLRAGTEVKP